MKKRGLVFAFVALSLFFVNLVSAQFGYGYGFSISNFFDSLDPNTVTYILLFFVIFILIMTSLMRMRLFKDAYGNPNKTNAGIISFCISAGTIYYLYRNGFNGEGIFQWLGFSGSLLSILLILLAIIILIFFIWKFRLKGLLFTLGALFILIPLTTDIIYEKGTSVLIGIILLAIWLFLLWLGRRKKRREEYGGYNSPLGSGPPGRGPGMFGRFRQRRSEIADIRHVERLEYEREKAARDYQKRLHDEEVRRRAARIAEIRKRRGQQVGPTPVDQRALQEQEREIRKQQEQAERDRQRVMAEQEKRRQQEIRIAEKEAADEYKRRQQEQARIRAEEDAYREEARRQQEIAKRRAEEEKKQMLQHAREEADKYKAEKESAARQQQLTKDQEKRWKKRNKYLREVNKQLGEIERYLRRANLSDKTRRNFEQRRQDLLNRKDVLLRYTPNSGNL